LALDGGEWAASFHNPGERTPGIHWIGGWASPRAIVDMVEKRRHMNVQISTLHLRVNFGFRLQ